ncbi:hypothetical protein Y032_0218g2427 [Ancylostoma ceylanicum]|uniref:Uncharacterized protein n=1 Tax=Ancylostoma ceylanicum TaxID=53326 RepID=A0A016SJP5_9BILA|nr:hypothetical protein Y032_0218g2427 [Ancylostoma ceylanicum]
MKSAQKKRKSDVQLDPNSTLPLKKDRPWYTEENVEVGGGMKDASEKSSRRKSIVGLGKGLLKKMRSSSALKDRNSRDSTMSAMSSSTSAMPVFKHPSLNITLDPMPEDQISFRSDSSAVSGDSCVLPPSFHRNKDLVRLVGNAPVDAQNWGDGISFTTESVSSEDSSSHLGSAASLCTPARDFKRGKSNRGSARSMPPESELIRGLCNSAIRRTFSSVSDSLASPQRFTRERSMRLREKLLLSASMAELPEEDVAPSATPNETAEETTTPIHVPEGSSRRSSLVWSTLRSKSRIFGSKKRGDGNSTPLSVSTIEPPANEDGTPSGRALSRSSVSSSSVQKRVSSALKKGFGLRGSNSNLAADLPARTPAGIIKRSSTTSKDRHRMSSTFSRRCSDVSSVLERQVRIDQKRKEAEEAELYMEKMLIGNEPVLDVLWRDGYDGVIVDVGATGLPVSDVAKKILADSSGSELHKICMSNPYKNGILMTPKGKPDVVYIATEKEDSEDKRVRVGIATGMREVFENGRLKKVLAYPFCVPENEEFSDFVVQQFLLTSYKAFSWDPKAKSFDGTITLTGVSKENCVQMRRLHKQLIATEIRPKIDAYASVASSAAEISPSDKDCGLPTENSQA